MIFKWGEFQHYAQQEYQSDNQSSPIITNIFSSNTGSSSRCYFWSKVDQRPKCYYFHTVNHIYVQWGGSIRMKIGYSWTIFR